MVDRAKSPARELRTGFRVAEGAGITRRFFDQSHGINVYVRTCSACLAVIDDLLGESQLDRLVFHRDAPKGKFGGIINDWKKLDIVESD